MSTLLTIRSVQFINDRSLPILTVKYFRILQLLITIGLILSIAGGTSSTIQPDGTVNVEATSKAGVIHFIIAYVGIAVMLVTSLGGISLIPSKERRVAGAIIIAMPFILVRLAYSACVVFVNNHTFNSVTGNIGVHVAMAVVEEFVVVALYILLGFFIDTLDKSNQDLMAAREHGIGRGHTERRLRRHAPKDAEAQPVDNEGYHGGNLPQIGRY